MGFGDWWLMVLRGSPFFFSPFFFVVCWFCDQRWAQMVVTGLEGVIGFFIGLGMNNSCGQRGYIRIAGAGLACSRSHGAKT